MSKKRGDIAVIGMAGKFPGANSVAQFWQNLCEGKESIYHFSDTELRNAGVLEADIQDSDYVKASPVLDSIDKFDPGFFKISPVEAQMLDPQIRLLLQCAWETLEDAGLSTQASRNIGVFAGAGGVTTSYYSHFINRNSHFEKVTAGQTHLGNDKDFLATYISYKLNLTGPSITVQTACSTSLVALHQACSSLHNEECDMALAGGVTIRVPHVQGYYHKSGHIVSKTGHVRTFDESADGVVFGSGLGLVLLRPLEKAIERRNHIYAVIKGSAINNDGKGKMSYAASSARGQISCITQALKNADVGPETIGYVEAHGTGTFMGDPEEVKALSNAFKKQTDEKGYCVLGAVKTNVGHLEAAAGITGLIKAALALHHGYIPPTLHYDKPNPRIKFERTPFYVNNQLQRFETPDSHPRRAAVNSLGVGGTNAFVILESFEDVREKYEWPENHAVVVPLSAKDESALYRYIEKLENFLSHNTAAHEHHPDIEVGDEAWAMFNIDAADLAYTLQVGRQHMDRRVAFVVRSTAELRLVLSSYLRGDIHQPQVLDPMPVADGESYNVFDENEDGQEVIQGWIRDSRWRKLAQAWVNGEEIPWLDCYVEGRPRKISLPTYPFAKESHWIDSGTIINNAQTLHPLLHSNTSDLSHQSFSSRFGGEEFFLRDHRVKTDGNKARAVLPGVAYLEMARVAVNRATNAADDNVLVLHDVVWLQPIVVTEPVEVSIALYGHESGDQINEVEYEIYSMNESDDEVSEVVHCQGMASFDTLELPANIDLPELKGAMKRSHYSADVIYPAMRETGLDYGPAHQAIAGLWLGENEVLAQLELPAAVHSSKPDFVLHPSMLDGALQATNALVVDLSNPPKNPLVPFTMGRVEVYGSCEREMFVHVRFAEGADANDKLIKLDIDMYCEQGQLKVRMLGFTARFIGKDADLSKQQEKSEVLMAEPYWQDSAISNVKEPVELTRHVLLVDLPHIDNKDLQLQMQSGIVLNNYCGTAKKPDIKAIIEGYREMALTSFGLAKRLLESKPGGKILCQMMVNRERTLLQGLSGLLKTVTWENPNIETQLLLVDSDISQQQALALLNDNAAHLDEHTIRYADGVRQVQQWRYIDADLKAPMAFKEQGVYLITGGLGGLGLLFARHILQQTRGGKVILTGRESFDAVIDNNEKFNKYNALNGGERLSYRQMDLDDGEQVSQVVNEIVSEFGALNGILHSAGMILDNFIIQKSSDDFAKVLAPKVNGTLHLDAATKSLELDFMVLFSSVTSAIGNIGQADYAAANGFMDHFAALRNRKMREGERQGFTLAVNWPLWAEGGMGLDQAAIDGLRQSTGIYPMQTQTGLDALDRALYLQSDIMLVMEGDLPQLKRTLQSVEQSAKVSADQPVEVEQTFIEGLSEKTEQLLCRELSSLLKLPPHKIDPDAAMEKYGIDSILAIDLTNKLEKSFGALSKTLFFEYQTIRELTEYFINNHGARLAGLLASPQEGDKQAESSKPEAKLSADKPSARQRFARSRQTSGSARGKAQNTVTAVARTADCPVAIIGLGGRYPGADNTVGYWENLRDGKDCVVEVPKSRWDWQEYFSEDRNQDGHHFSKWGGFIEGVDEFDPRFFNISPREAQTMDPQERLFLQTAWIAVEDAGYTRSSLQIRNDKGLPGQVGVYAGVMYGEYQLLGAEASLRGQRMGFASNPASIANRVSYVLNLHGPSMTIDTMCSSSLTTIHLACQDLKLGITDLAIAGGVNVTIHPNKYLMLSSGQFISSDGHCQSFGEGGDGYIPAEGVGAVVLKRFEQAKADGNHIYAVIRGSALSHGGKTNGYTVPNPQAQADAVGRALADANVDPRHISYIEAHGTGTKLGDPIEIAALTRAFYGNGQTAANGKKDRAFCDIGSAKSNIGHAESAAGIAGLTKILLQMHYRQIVPSLHSSKLNPHIDFDNTPFVVNQQLKAWPQPELDGRPLPRIAGVSSFGAGGANAHLIVEEYSIPESDRKVPVQYGALIVPISARTADQLKQKVQDLLVHVEKNLKAQYLNDRPWLFTLDRVAYTLQVGREAMGERLAIVVNSMEELADKLRAVAEGDVTVADVYRGEVKEHQDTLSLLGGDSDFLEAVNKWISSAKLAKLAELWVKGFELDWSAMYRDNKPRFMSLPGYPFAKDRFWVDVDINRAVTVEQTQTEHSLPELHPLLQQNTSTLNEQRYSSSFNTQSKALHVRHIHGRAIAAGSVYLDMVQGALAKSQPERTGQLRLTQLETATPLALDGSLDKTHIGLFPAAQGAVEFDIYSEQSGEELLHGQGVVDYVEAACGIVNIDGYLSEADERYDGGHMQTLFAEFGVRFAQSALQEVAVKDNRALAKLHSAERSLAAFVDGAMQACLALQPSDEQWALSLAMPFELANLTLAGELDEQVFAAINKNENGLAITLCDDNGNILAELEGVKPGKAPKVLEADANRRQTTLVNRWTEVPAVDAQNVNAVVLYGKSNKRLAQQVARVCDKSQLLAVESTSVEALITAVDAHNGLIDLSGDAAFETWLPLVQAVVEHKRSSGFNCIFAFGNDIKGADKAGLYHMLSAEYPAINSATVHSQNAKEIAESLSRAAEFVSVKYQDGKRLHAQLIESTLKTTGVVNANGVVLITGGTRGIGMACAKHLVEKHGIRKLVLTGREVLPSQDSWQNLSGLSDSTKAKIADIQGLIDQGAEVLTLSFPLDDAQALKTQYQQIKKQFGSVTGVLHAAGLTDSENPAFIRKDVAGIKRVLAPKVSGLNNLVSVLEDKALDFVVLFSSVSSQLPSLGAGQSDYVMANHYMDSFALVNSGKLPVVAVQWPSWKETGMGEVTNQTYRKTGLLSMTNVEGFDALDSILCSDLNPAVVMPVTVNADTFDASVLLQTSINTKTEQTTKKAEKPAAKAVSQMPAGGSAEVQKWLAGIFENELRMEAGELDMTVDLADYGIDSILMVQVLRTINKEVGEEVDPSVVLEYPTVVELADYLLAEYAAPLNAKFGGEQPEQPTEQSKVEVDIDDVPQGDWQVEPVKHQRKDRTTARSVQSDETYAVVGLSCRFAGAENLDEYWSLLREGRSSIKPVPFETWGKQTDYYGALLDEIYGFDSNFFLINEDDAKVMDPQALVLLEESLKTLYHAGYNHKELAGNNVGVYVGARSQSRASLAQLEAARNPILAVGQNYLAANLSQFFNFAGPSLVVDTACSSAMVGMRMAIDAMHAGQIEGALVGGVSLQTSPLAHDVFASRDLHADKGQFHILDRRASGVVIGEGCGMVYIKPMSAAVRDGDTIYAEISALEINNDGRTAGPATPNMQAQQAVMQSALSGSGIAADKIGYLEVNGSGSEITDLLEIKAVNKAYGDRGESACYLGSMKPNIGHPLCAEGIASFIKVVLMLHHQQLVPFLSGQQGLEHFDLNKAGFALPQSADKTELEYAAMNCFADGGTNAHVIVKAGSGNVERAPLPLPTLNRVDVRSGEPVGQNTLSHRFDGSKAWQSTLTTEHPVLAHHKVLGKSLLPGLGWIDLIYGWFNEAGLDCTELSLRNLSIYRPLIVTDEQPVKLTIRAQGDKVRTVTVTDSAGERYISCEMHSVANQVFNDSVNIAEIAKQARTVVDMNDIYERYRALEVVHTDVMQAKGKIYTLDDATWVHVKVPGGAKAGYHFHPALIDGSAIGTADLFGIGLKGEEERLFLPMFYEQFSASTEFGGEVYTRVKHDSVVDTEQLQGFNLEFFNAKGEKLAELVNFKNKQVRHAGLIDAERKTNAEAIVVTDSNFDSFEAMLQSVIGAQLKIEPSQVPLESGYYEMGLESVGLLAVVKSIAAMLGENLSPLLMFEHTNIAALAKFLAGKYRLPNGNSQAAEAQTATAQPVAKRTVKLTGLTTHCPLGFEAADTTSAVTRKDIAVIGMAGRYPGANDLAEFWQNLKEGKDSIETVPEARWSQSHFAGMLSPSGKTMSQWGGFINDVDCFDPLFFNVSPKEATVLDPQERLFLQTCWEAMEDAGYTPQNIVESDEHGRRQVGVFVGVMHKDYSMLQAEAARQGQQISMSLNYAGIANRVSYFSDFHGPSMAIDTVCSSSLTAVHLALESLYKGDSKVAFAGGVNLSLHPNKYQSYGLMDFHSSNGRCTTFGEGGDGYVSSEGVGAVVLKPLSKAIEDGDHIEAVIKGSAINHVGRVSGITVPSPVAQGAMIADCLRHTGVDPESISYIEAHGTGTSLGDPIEIEGLNKAFGEFTEAKNFCALGSVKSNIGHCEAAAGISGMCKTILQLKNQTLVQSLHSDTINPYLDLADSPFFVQRQTSDWHIGNQQVRRAGISSFGATGSNAHVILEEYASDVPAVTQAPDGVLVVLSAKNLERLREYAGRLVSFLEINPQTDIYSLAYTLQVGRVELEERLALVATSIEQLVTKLLSWLENDKGLLQGNIKAFAELSALFDSDGDLQEVVEKLLSKRKLDKLGQFWVKGMALNWSRLYPQGAPGRIGLPTYPFAKQRFWVNVEAEGQKVPALHPLLQQNVSDLAQQRYRTTLNGDEFYLVDHQVGGDKILPGVAYLEMAQVAARQAMPGETADYALELNNIIWVQPVVVEDKAIDVDVALTSREDGTIGFEAQSGDKVHCQGRALFTEAGQVMSWDIQQLKSIGKQSQSDSLYSAFRYMDIYHGPRMRGVEALYLGKGQLLAELKLPESVRARGNEFVLHPAMMDSAFQATLGLSLDRGKLSKQPLLPFALDSLKVTAPCANVMYAYVRHADGHSNNNHEVARYDIDLMDEHGQVCVQMQGLSSRRAVSTDVEAKLHSYLPVFDAVSNEVCDQESLSPDATVYLTGDKEAVAWLAADYPNAQWLEYDKLAEAKDIEHLVWVAPASTQQTSGDDLLEVFNLIKSMQNRSKLNWTFITRNSFKVFDEDIVDITYAGVNGLVGTLSKEFPHWSVRLLDIDELNHVRAKTCLQLGFDKQGNGLAYRRGEWHKQSLLQSDELPKAKSLYRENGVYVVIGGAGGLGEVFSHYLAKNFNARTVWIGRKVLNIGIQVKIDNIAQVGPAPLYVSADASDSKSMGKALKTIEKECGQINGVVHSAIVLNDQSLSNMDEAGFNKALGAKVDVSLVMDQVFGELDLDFMLFFSSVNSFIRGAGQGNYAAGCTFKDSFAQSLNDKYRYPVKVVNWGFWGSVGSVAEPQYIKRLAQMGLASIEVEEGLAALNRLMHSSTTQISVMKTFPGKSVFQLELSDKVESYGYRQEVLATVKQQLPRQLGRKLLGANNLKSLEVELPVEDQLELADELMLAGILSAGLIANDNLAVSSKAASFYQRWLEHSIDYLKTRGWLADDLSLAKPVRDLDTLWLEWQLNRSQWTVNAHLEAQTKLVEACLKALPQILKGDLPATDVMFPNSSMVMVEGIYKNNDLSDFYNEILGQTMVHYLRKLLKVEPQKRIRLLEIGAGTGGTTARLLPMLKEFEDNIDEYCYTDLSKAFLMHAEKHYLPQFPTLTTAIFDATKPLSGQGIDAGQFDIVIATNVLHATPNIRQTVRNAKAVLNNEGILLLNEISTWKLFNHLTFGLLEGWWLYQDAALRLPGNPGLEPAKWQQALTEEGYHSIYFAANKAHHLGQQVVAAASDGWARQPVEKVAKVEAKPIAKPVAKPQLQSKPQVVAAPHVQTQVQAQPQAVATKSTADISEQVFTTLQACVAEAVQMSVADVESDRSFSEYGVDSIIAVQLINQINEKLDLVLQTTVLFDYGTLEQLSAFVAEEYRDKLAPQTATVAASVSTQSAPVVPSPAPVTSNVQMGEGQLADTLRDCVAGAIQMSAGDIEGDREFSEYGVDSIIAVQLINQINEKLDLVLQTTVLFDYGTLDKLVEHIQSEYSDKLTTTVTSAPVAAPVAAPQAQVLAAPNRMPSATASEPVAAPVAQVAAQAVGQGLAYHRLLLNGPGEITDIQLTQDYLPAPATGQVCVALKAFSLNFGDLLCVRGLYPTMPPYPFTPGYDGSGVVIAVGAGVRKVKVGDEVIVEADKALGAHATAMLAQEHNVTLKPKNMPFEDACALPVVSITMIDAFNKANLKPGESILIQTAAGGTGLIAVQLAKHAGATIYATAGSAHKLQYLKDLGVDHVINYQEVDFESEIDRLTQGRGVDVVINTLSGDAIQKGMNCLATGGRYIEIAMTALKSAKAIDLSILSNNQSFHSVDMRRFALESPEMTEGYRQQMLSLYNQGVLRPTICQAFSFDQLQDAYVALSERSNIGKVVVTVPTEWQVDSAALVAQNQSLKENIAIVGMSGRFAESENLEQFWQHLADGDDLVREVTRWAPTDSTPTPEKPFCGKGSFVETMDMFDPLFFKISPLEALHMDPQQRVILEESYKALEDAGYAGDNMSQSACGVYIGCIDGLYDSNFTDEPPGQAFWGNACSVIPARIAYYLDLHGPAIAVDTACSSSLVAIHMACQGLWTQETEMALAGGVFLQSSPKFYQHCNRAGMLSPNGKCHTFDARADGFVPGEGAGVVVLKRLSDANEANDNIHGVIVASGINQDGSTNGITAPSSLSQTRLETSVYEKFNIAPASLQLIEAHGTGTKLGDPIEFGALSKAFGNVAKQSCAIGSVKTNIGHAVTAAGVAGVFKLLMAMKHEQIPPSLHFDNANPVIDFENSPFYVPTETKDWPVQNNQPRRAAVSSFGFSGTNAHIVLEQAPARTNLVSAAPGYLIVLSALSVEQRATMVDNLIGYLENNDNVSLNDLSYTLFVGRQHLNHRLSCVVRNQDELVSKLKLWRQSGKATQVVTAQLVDKDIRQQASIKEYGNQCINNCQNKADSSQYLENLNVLADLYGQGYKLDYQRLFGAESGRLSLPTYPFAKESFWAGDKPKSPTRVKASNRSGSKVQSQLHPLLHANTSDLTQQRFSSELDANAFYLADHQVEIQGQQHKVLPAVAYLEMAHAAIIKALPNPEGVVVLSNTVWAQPIVVSDVQPVDIALFAEDGPAGPIDFEVYTENDGHSQVNLHCQGTITLESLAEPQWLDVESVKSRLQQQWQGSELYPIFAQMGLHYGPAQQGLQTLYLGADEALAQVFLPAQLQAEFNDFVLHPSMLDSALQATIGLIEDLNNPPSQPALPFALDSLQVFAPCSEQMWAHVSVIERNQDSIKLDLSLCDSTGKPCIQILGFSTRAQSGVSDERFDESFYQDVLDRLLDSDLSVDQALDLE